MRISAANFSQNFASQKMKNSFLKLAKK